MNLPRPMVKAVEAMMKAADTRSCLGMAEACTFAHDSIYRAFLYLCPRQHLPGFLVPLPTTASTGLCRSAWRCSSRPAWLCVRGWED